MAQAFDNINTQLLHKTVGYGTCPPTTLTWVILTFQSGHKQGQACPSPHLLLDLAAWTSPHQILDGRWSRPESPHRLLKGSEKRCISPSQSPSHSNVTKGETVYAQGHVMSKNHRVPIHFPFQNPIPFPNSNSDTLSIQSFCPQF